jgi:xanthine dehydrogenase accessory factor
MLDRSFIRQIESLQHERIPFCVATIVDARGSIPQIAGARAIFTRKGLAHGTVGGGTLEATCQKKALELIDGDKVAGAKAVSTHFQRYNLQKDLGMTCGGELALFFEVHRQELTWNIMIFGAGHVAQTLCRFLVELDCHVVCVDTRAEWLERLPRSDKLEACHVTHYCDGIDRIVPGADVILMTMGHGSDMPILKAIENRKIPIAHLGVIGSDAKSGIVRRQLAADGLPREFIDSIVCPLGDKIGNNTPAEVAVGIVSQLLRLRNAG